jgi:ribosomal protein S18 acetylase RimI-like enzyme
VIGTIQQAVPQPVSLPATARAAATLARAFHDDPVVRYLRPDDAGRLRWLQVVFGVMVRFCQLYGRAQQVRDCGAVALWVAPEHDRTTVWHYLRANGVALGVHSPPQAFRRGVRYLAASEASHRRYVQGPHWYLPFLGVDPALQGRGFGSGLLRAALDEADGAGLACYLEAPTDRTRRLYERYAFRAVGEWTVGRHGPGLWAMVRAPQPTGWAAP